MTKARSLVVVLTAVLLCSPMNVQATPPPQELAAAKVAASRKSIAATTFRITYLGRSIREVNGKVQSNARTLVLSAGGVISSKSLGADRVLWIAVAAADPVSEIQSHGIMATKKRSIEAGATEFVFTYGATPSFSIDRVSWNLLGFTFKDKDKVLWKAVVERHEGVVATVRVFREGRVVLTARNQSAKPSP